jgi:Tol biopolymer transport system component
VIGHTISHYRITEKIGGGGMGVVYKAEDTKLKRTVALKFLPPDLVHDDDSKQRFLHEAQAASAIQHNNICVVHDIDETNDGQMFIVMDLYQGGTLKKKIEAGPLGIIEALEHALQIAEGLAEAHKRGIIHRDLKPANVMIAESGVAKIVDFGLAKLVGMTKLTRTGSTLGTIAYMSPEQLQGVEVDARADIFSFGVVTFEMLTRQLPFQGDHEAALMYSIINEEPQSIEKYRRDAPPVIVNLIERCLEKNPADRYQTFQDCAIEVRRALRQSGSALMAIGADDAIVERGVSVRSPGKRKARDGRFVQPVRNRWYFALAVVVIGTIVVGYLLSLGRSAEKQGLPVPATFTQVTFQDGMEIAPNISPNGEFVAYQKRVDGRMHILLQKIGGSNTIDLTKDSKLDCLDPKFSPNGDQIAFWSQGDSGGVYVVGAMGESQRRIADMATGGGISWLPDGRKLLVSKVNRVNVGASARGELWVIDLSGGERKFLTQGGEFLEPLMSPHGKRIAFWREENGIAQIFTMPGVGGPVVLVTPDSFRSVSPHWSPDGRFIYFQSDRGGTWNLRRIAIDEETGELMGVPRPILTPAMNSILGSISKDGKRLIYMSTRSEMNLSKVQIDAGKATVIQKPALIWASSAFYFNNMPVHSPDGQWIAASNGTNAGVQGDLFVIRNDGSGFRKLTDDPAEDILWQWSSDGEKLVFVSNRNDQGYQVWVIRPDGSGLEQLTKLKSKPSFVHLLPRGRALILNLDSDATCLVDLTRPLDERKPLPLPPYDSNGNRFRAWSVLPDGKQIFGGVVDSSLKSTLPGSYLFDMERQKYTKVLDRTFPAVSWLSDNRRFVSNVKGDFYVVDIKTKEERLLLRSSDYSQRPLRNGGVSWDAKFLYLIVQNTQSDIWLAKLQEE